ncbi:MAG: hypothetical protein U0704_09765 [Candidatus Eisenbacteria bacterium]
MTWRKATIWGVLVSFVLANGCTTMREVPRTELAAVAQRKGVRVVTRDSLVYTFDWATFDADSLTGYRERDELETTLQEVAVHRIALDDVQRLTARRVDWYRTGMLSGSIVVAAVAAGLTVTALKGGSGSSTVDPCPRGCGGVPAIAR